MAQQINTNSQEIRPVIVTNPVQIKNDVPLRVVLEPVKNTHSQIGPFAFQILNAGVEYKINNEQWNALDQLFSSGSAKNESTNTIWVRLSTAFFTGGYVDIPLQAGEAVRWRDILIQKVSVPNNAANAGATVNVSVVGYSYFHERSTPSLELI